MSTLKSSRFIIIISNKSRIHPPYSFLFLFLALTTQIAFAPFDPHPHIPALLSTLGQEQRCAQTCGSVRAVEKEKMIGLLARGLGSCSSKWERHCLVKDRHRARPRELGERGSKSQPKSSSCLCGVTCCCNTLALAFTTKLQLSQLTHSRKNYHGTMSSLKKEFDLQ